MKRLNIFVDDTHSLTFFLFLTSSTRSHTCAVFSNSQLICFGARDVGVGEVGASSASVLSVSSCGTATCAAVSSVGFVSFSDTSVAVRQVSTGLAHTCGTSLATLIMEIVMIYTYL
jgi:hypothetical protein